MKVGKKNSFYIHGSLLQLIHKIDDLKKKSLQNLGNLGHFFPWEILCIGPKHIMKETQL